MDLALFLARLLLAGVFGVAGLAKLADPAGSRQTMIAFGVPAGSASPFGILLTLAELATAFALFSAGLAWWGALGALTLLFLFIVGISINLVRGRTPNCRCFGQLHSTPVGWATLVRNGALAVPAGLFVWYGRDNSGLSAIGWMSSLTTAQAVELILGTITLAVLIAEGWILLELLRQNRQLLSRIEALESRVGSQATAFPSATPPATGLPIGTSAPAFRLLDLTGKSYSLDDLRAESKPVLLVFSDPACRACAEILPDLARWQRDHAAEVTIVLISRGATEINRANAAGCGGLTHVLLQNDHEVVKAYKVERTPTAVLIHSNGTIGSGLAPGAEAIRRLVAQTVLRMV
jgi:peroxiredoxin